MKCYRNGGCGPYEMYSCNECPASKPEYLKRYILSDKEIEVERKMAKLIEKLEKLNELYSK